MMFAGARARFRARWERWLFQTDRSSEGSVTLGQRQIFILPSGTGLLFGLVLVVMYLGAVNYSLGLGHALVFLLASLGLTGMVHTFRNIVGLQLTAIGGEPVFAGQTAKFRVRANNDRSEVRPQLSFCFWREDTVTVDLHAREDQLLELPCKATKRGYLIPPRLTLSTRYPLGFFRGWSHPRLTLRTLVYPRPIEVPLPPDKPGLSPGARSNASGDDDFAGFRDRQPGDPLRHVAWKAHARDPAERPLQIKRFMGALEPELILDWADLDPALSIEDRLSILTGWVLQARQANLVFTLQMPQESIGPGADDAHITRCLTQLALHGE